MSTNTVSDDLRTYTGDSQGWARKRDTMACGESTALHIMDAIAVARAEGYAPVGHGPAPSGAEIIYLPSCSSAGYRGRCEKIYFARWAKK